MKFFSRKTVLEVCAGIAINLTSGWFGVVLIAPGFLGVPSEKYLAILTPNIIFGILGLLISFWVVEKGKKL